MVKFESDDWTLDICEWSKPIPTALNNQIILLLSDLGVPNETFLKIQQRYFQSDDHTVSNDDIKKNKYPLPKNECRYMFGCSLKSPLKPGQCFIRYEILDDNRQQTNRFACVQGRVIVTKNPCPYAGDMIELWAVDIPELYDLKDVINDNIC
ncbi:unnamed protein product, partial [Didymodactylos carnosus]